MKATCPNCRKQVNLKVNPATRIKTTKYFTDIASMIVCKLKELEQEHKKYDHKAEHSKSEHDKKFARKVARGIATQIERQENAVKNYKTNFNELQDLGYLNEVKFKC